MISSLFAEATAAADNFNRLSGHRSSTIHHISASDYETAASAVAQDQSAPSLSPPVIRPYIMEQFRQLEIRDFSLYDGLSILSLPSAQLNVADPFLTATAPDVPPSSINIDRPGPSFGGDSPSNNPMHPIRDRIPRFILPFRDQHHRQGRSLFANLSSRQLRAMPVLRHASSRIIEPLVSTSTAVKKRSLPAAGKKRVGYNI